ncbi:cytochrome c biogenesis protein ResB [Pelagicoccus mobilis]|uniref:Cytochrome c biogenesis protein ResB n=1 Tax=Pelagicoccus mobilis TaxID=415221 RepID=A0A934RTE8_9BACT|nr:cytochrome c biogenesis protein ResB [Pelagicoccus mobilis]MBK1876542.1 cytochrome c biogenesis protein ResB [Pelagicoccus mobilis]
MKPLLKLLASLELTIGCLVLAMVLILFGTLDQTHLGIHGATEKYFYTVFVTQYVEFLDINVPYMPGGYLIGFALFLNNLSAMIYRFRMGSKKLGIWLIHLGFVLLLLGEFISSVFQEEANLTLDEGGTADFTESTSLVELAVIDTTDTETDRVYAIPEAMLERKQQIEIDELPFHISVDVFMPNSALQRRDDTAPESAHVVNQGFGLQYFAIEVPETGKMSERNQPSTIVTLFAKESVDGESEILGTWLAREFMRHQSFSYQGRNYDLVLRRQREIIDYYITLNDFSHDRYLGTNIPKNFSSDVTVKDKRTGLEQDFLIYMNNPLRYDDLTFYQASFLPGDQTSILQVVRNPGRSLPYISTTVMTLGLAIQFAFGLQRFSKKRKKADA